MRGFFVSGGRDEATQSDRQPPVHHPAGARSTGLRRDLVAPDHTISGEVGYAAMQGKRWGLMAEKYIDHLFYKGHCRESIEWDEILKPPYRHWE